MFGANTADSQVIFVNNIDLGNSGTNGSIYLQYREINVNNGTAGTGSALMTGTISSTDVHGLVKTGGGTLILSNGNNSYSGGTVVYSGTLLLANGFSGSATGSGPLTVNSGATLGGTGSSISSLFTINGTVQVGNGTDALSQTTFTSGTAFGNSTFSGANVEFTLDSTSSNSNILNVGNTPITFASTTLTLSLINGSTPQASELYELFSGTGSNQYLGLGLSGNLITSGLTINSAFLAALPAGDTAQLEVVTTGGVDNIDLQLTVVPEPGTWAMLLSGFGSLLVLGGWRRRRFAALRIR
jgi:autotransporter-associated beta strand protein